jgi:hypothetical protein
MSETCDEISILTPEELKQQVINAELSFLPGKSREKYLKAYQVYNEWRLTKGASSFSATVLLSYYIDLSQTRRSSTLLIILIHNK